MENRDYAWVNIEDCWYSISRTNNGGQKVECTQEDIREFLSIKNWDMEAIQLKIREILFDKQLELDLWEQKDE